MSLKIAAIADLHGYLLTLEPCDLVCICGDISPLSIQSNHKKARQWLKNEFKPWCESLPCDKVIFIAGNHDLAYRKLEFMYEHFPKDGKVTYLFHESYSYKGCTIFGTPYCRQFGNWAFMESDDELNKLYESIPENVDILLSHDVPYDTCDVLLQNGYYTGEHIGNKPLRNAIIRTFPKNVFVGHLHSVSKEVYKLRSSNILNCSIKNENYEPVYRPQYLEI